VNTSFVTYSIAVSTKHWLLDNFFIDFSCDQRCHSFHRFLCQRISSLTAKKENQYFEKFLDSAQLVSPHPPTIPIPFHPARTTQPLPSLPHHEQLTQPNPSKSHPVNLSSK